MVDYGCKLVLIIERRTDHDFQSLMYRDPFIMAASARVTVVYFHKVTTKMIKTRGKCGSYLDLELFKHT